MVREEKDRERGKGELESKLYLVQHKDNSLPQISDDVIIESRRKVKSLNYQQQTIFWGIKEYHQDDDFIH